MPIRAIIFDFDGVVVNSEPLYQEAEKQLFAEYGIEVPPQDWKYFKGTSELTFYTMMQTKYGVKAEFETIQKRGRELLKKSLSDHLDYIPGFLEFFYKISNTYLTGLVTSTPKEIMDFIFSNTKIKNLFTHIITADDVAETKPSPLPYLRMMERLNVQPQEAVIIEDSLNGLSAATQSGAHTIALLTSLTLEDLFEDTSIYPANNFQEVEEIIKKLDP